MSGQQSTQRKDSRRQTRFLILGLPRSGTTYLMTLLNTHPGIMCAGEQFNPYSIIYAKGESQAEEDVLRRDQAPRVFSRAFFEAHKRGGFDAVGYKFMLGHNIRFLKALPQQQDLLLIYLHRKNRLAQISSLLKAENSRRWAQTAPDEHVAQRIDAGPRKISQHWHEFETWDFLFSDWLAGLPQKTLKLEYCDLFKDGFEKRICRFLGVRHHPEMHSPLVKQGSNVILDRFTSPDPIRAYFTALGREDWLGAEI